MSKKKTHEEFLSNLKEKGIEYVPLDQYNGGKVKIRFQCKNGHIWEAIPMSIQRGYGCPYCAHNKQLTDKEFRMRLEKITQTIKPLEKYRGTNTKIKCKCTVCGHEWFAKPSKLYLGNGCPECSKVKQGITKIKNTKEKFIAKLKERTPNIVLVGDYKGTKTNTEFRCQTCGKILKMPPNRALYLKYGCKSCANDALKLTNDDFLARLSNVMPDIVPVEKYISFYRKIKYYCKKCGKYNYATPSNLLHGFGCPTCASSKGEKKCADILDKFGCIYKQQYVFNNLVGINGGLLRFDFGILDKNSQLLGLIEYDGIFHFEKLYEDDGFEKIQIHDRIKNEYCRKHNIPLLRIPYQDFENMEGKLLCFIRTIKKKE